MIPLFYQLLRFHKPVLSQGLMLYVVVARQKANYRPTVHYAVGPAVTELVYLEQTIYCKCERGIACFNLYYSLAKS